MPVQTRRENKAQRARLLRKVTLAKLKQRILYGVDLPQEEADPTKTVNSVLLLGTEGLGYKCLSGYHDELVAWHLGYKRAEGYGRFDDWKDKAWTHREDMDGPRHLSAVLAPRGSGKTVWATVLGLWYGVRWRNCRVLVTSKTDRAAVRLGGVLRRLLLRPKMVEIFGELRGDAWDKQGFNIAGRTRAEGANTFTLLGSGTQIEGVHFDVIFADDIVTLMNSRTEGQRGNLVEWFWQTLVPTCRPISDVLGRGRIHASGTRYHAADMHQHLQDSSKAWASAYIAFPALRPSKRWLEVPKNVAATNAWTHAVTEALSKGQDPPPAPEPEGSDSYSAWAWDSLAPEFLPVKTLLEMRADMPRPYFDAQYQVDARLLKGRIFKADWVEWVKEEPKMRLLMGCSGMDLGLKVDENADYTALLHVKLDRKWKHPDTGQLGRLLVWDATVDHLSLAGKLQLIQADYRVNRPRSQGVEQVQAQSLLLENPELSALPVVGVRPNGDKLLRASLLLTYFENGRIFFVERKGPRAARVNEYLQTVIYQLLDFQGDGSTHDDAVDALGFAVDQVVHKWRQASDIGQAEAVMGKQEDNPMGLRGSYGSTWKNRKR